MYSNPMAFDIHASILLCIISYHPDMSLSDECPIPDLPKELIATRTKVVEESAVAYTMEYQCMNGYKLNGPKVQRCSPQNAIYNQTNAWPKQMPTCTVGNIYIFFKTQPFLTCLCIHFDLTGL